MKILLVNYEYKGQGGGAGQQLYYLAQALRDFGHDVSLIIGWDYKLGEPDLLERVTTYIVKHKRKNVQLSTALGMLFFVVRGLVKICEITRKQRYDIIHFYFSVPTGILKFGIYGNVPYIVSLLGMDIPELHKDRNKGLSVITAALNKTITSNAAAVICNSTESAVVYNKFAADISLNIIQTAADPRITYKNVYSEQISKFVYIGRLISLKRIDILIDAVTELHKKYSKISMDIYGDGYLSDSLNQHISRNGAKSFINILGFIKRDQLMVTLQGYDVFTFASVSDSGPNVLIEAMASGLPVVAARAGGSIDIVVDNETGLFIEPCNIEDTIKKLEYCINNPDKMKEYGMNGRKRVEEFYSINNTAQQHIKLYNRCLHRGDL